jgi:flagellar biosynthetic protein FlhB
MADDSEKTEQPTQARLDEARRKGDVAKSQEVPIWFMMMGAAAVLAGAGPLAHQLVSPLVSLLDHPHTFSLEGGGAQRLLMDLGMAVIAPLLVVLLVIGGASLAGHIIQVMPLWTTEKMKPDIAKLNPVSGFGRMFGAQGWMNFLKSILKVIAMSAAMAYALWPKLTELSQAGALPVMGVMHLIQSLSGRMLIAALVAVGIIAAIDYIFQRQSFMNRMKMSRQEIRDEFKQAEGDPHIKAKLRAIRQERSRRRMLANVAKATVVVTNPTHYAVALKYDPDVDAAPTCVAKGVDAVALRIREKAGEADVPIVENVSLARALFATVEIDEIVPREHFEAVAKVISFVMNTAKGKRPRPTPT